MKKREVRMTNDGSQSVYDPEKNVLYHSHHGALAESRHVFIEKGLVYAMSCMQREVRVLEIGYGTGLNALLSILKAEETRHYVYYEALEPEPLDKSILQALRYPELTGHPHANSLFKSIHNAARDVSTRIAEHFSFHPLKVKVRDYHTSGRFDAVFYDAFAPSDHPEMWVPEIFEKLHGIMNPGGVLTTFCAQGAFKRTLRSAGFSVEVLEGPPGKREMTRAVKMIHT